MNVHLQDIRRTGRTNLQITLIHFSNQTLLTTASTPSLLNDYKAAGGVCKDYCDCPCTEEEIAGVVCLVNCCYVLDEFLVAGLSFSHSGNAS